VGKQHKPVRRGIWIRRLQRKRYGPKVGREGLYEYLEPEWSSARRVLAVKPAAMARPTVVEAIPQTLHRPTVEAIRRGKQAASRFWVQHGVLGAMAVCWAKPARQSQDIRNAVEAARKAEGWRETRRTTAQVLYYIAENLSQRAREITDRLAAVVGKEQAHAKSRRHRTRFSLTRLGRQYDGAVQQSTVPQHRLAMHEPVGTIGVCPARGCALLGFYAGDAAIAMGNRVVAIPSETYPLIMGDLYQVLNHDLPAAL